MDTWIHIKLDIDVFSLDTQRQANLEYHVNWIRIRCSRDQNASSNQIAPRTAIACRIKNIIYSAELYSASYLAETLAAEERIFNVKAVAYSTIEWCQRRRYLGSHLESIIAAQGVCIDNWIDSRCTGPWEVGNREAHDKQSSTFAYSCPCSAYNVLGYNTSCVHPALRRFTSIFANPRNTKISRF